MRALVYEAPWELMLREVPDPVPGPDEIAVAVRAAGICGSDVHGFTGSTGRRTPPLVMGHELAGVVREVGPGVERLSQGDRVVLRSIVTCGTCRSCRVGRLSICLNRRGLGVVMPGGYADAIVVPARLAERLPDEISFEEGALVEPLAVAMHAVNLTQVRLMDRVAIVGAGTIGLLALLAVRIGGAGRTFVTDRVPRRLELARELGADVTIDVRSSDPVEVLREASDREMADVVLEAVGLDATSRQSLALVRAGGHVTWIGNSDPLVRLDMQDVVGREVTVRGAYGFDDEFEDAIDAIRTGRVPVRRLIDRVAPLADGPSLMTALARGELDATKVILAP